MSIAIVDAFLRRQREGNLIPLSAFKTDINPRMLQIRDRVGDLTGWLNLVTCFTPDPKIVEEAENAIYHAIETGKPFNPMFTYSNAEKVDTEDMRRQLLELLRELDAIPTQDSRASEWFRRALRHHILQELQALLFIDGMCNRTVEGKTGDALSKEAIPKIYQGPDAELSAYAKADYRRRTRWPKNNEKPQEGCLSVAEKARLKQMAFGPERTAEIYRWGLQECGLLRTTDDGVGFEVQVGPQFTAMDMKHRAPKPVMCIPTRRNELLNGINGPPLVDHEIGHARQTENGWVLFGIGGRRLTGHDETIYEAYACWLEAQLTRFLFGNHEERPFNYVYPTSVDLAVRGASFYDVVMDQFHRFWGSERGIPTWPKTPKKNQVSDELWKNAMYYAWRAAYRIFRGMRDTRNQLSFANFKDLGYLRGELIMNETAANNAPHHVEACAVAGSQGLVWMGEVDIKPEDIPFQNRNLGQRMAEKLLKDGANVAF